VSIKLRFDPHPEFPGSRVWTEDAALAPVAGMLSSDLQSPASARRWAKKVNMRGNIGGAGGGAHAVAVAVHL